MPLKKKNRRTQKNNINKRVQKMTKRKSLGKNTRKNLRKKKKPRTRRFRGGSSMGHRLNSGVRNGDTYRKQKHLESFLARLDEQEKSIMIWTDPGADIDDEIALWYLVKQKKIRPENTIIFIGGKGKKNSFITWINKHCSELNEYMIIGENDDKPDVFPTDLIIIAPGIDSLGDKIHLDKLTRVSFQGSLQLAQQLAINYSYLMEDGRAAFNDNGSVETITKIKNKSDIDSDIDFKCVTTAECNNKLLFSDANFDRFNIPEAIRESIRQTVFQNTLGRMHPDHPYNKFAEGLINPEIKGANYEIVKQIYESMKKAEEQAAEQAAEPPPTQKLILAVQAYVKKLPNPRDSTEGYLLQMCRWIRYIIKAEPLDKDDNLINSGIDGNSQKLYIQYPEGYNNFTQVGIYSPAFDLLTVIRHFNISL